MQKIIRSKKILFMVIVIGLCFFIGVSYAWWSHTVSQESINRIDTDCLKLTIVDEVDESGESTAIRLEKAYPLTDAEASLLKAYVFKIQNICNTTAEYSINLEIMGVSNKINSEYIAINFNNTGKKILTEYQSIEPNYKDNNYAADEARYLTNGILEPNESRSYNLKLWIDESVTVEDDAMNKSFIGKISISSVLNQLATNNLSEFIIRKSEMDSSIVKIEHEVTEQTPALTDYRYTGANPDNYVCFGYEGARCPDENLYRIIGVIPTQSSENGPYENRVKLLKATEYIGPNAESGSNYSSSGKGYKWNTTDNNKWEESSLKEELNTSYWNSLGEYQKYIELSKWYLGAPSERSTAEIYYKLERGSIPGSIDGFLSYIDNIGLMYPSDYGYSIDKNYWSNIIEERYKNNAWLYSGNDSMPRYHEWLLSPTPTDLRFWYIHLSGITSGARFSTSYIWLARPTFYLKGNVLYKSGEGTINNPYYLSI